ncbi:oxidoreductase [Bailinhaonella thermotolerans]|uniref:Oxidoreductase n=1 Tax=Bailinhaonella thermotolerans TaxID=1070861 RepID=A0A3A4A899_9ACTN|nr:oxidoreductase [Bailinhaonella thermotolerans]RJL22123.1 oxidoreductase [Bailinhaonella thermotolerans]
MSDPLARIADLPGVPEAVDAARESVDRLYRHKVLRRRQPEVSAESALRGAWASAVLEGAQVKLDELREGDVQEPLVQGALRATAELGRLRQTWRLAPRQVLARLHALAGADLLPQEELGRPRVGPTDSDPYGLGPAPGVVEMSARLDALFAVSQESAEAPAVVVGAIVHGELAVLRPFGAVDGLVARVAERLTLIEQGLDPKALVPVELGHREQSESYADALRGYASGTSAGVAGWVRHCAEAVVLGARESTAVCEALLRG